MRRVLNLQIVIMLFFIFSANAVVLFEIKDESGYPVFVVSDEGVTILNNEPGKALGDTLMTISSRSIKAFINNTGKGLSRSFSVSTASSKGDDINLLEVGTESTQMREAGGNDYSNFSPENIFLGLNAGSESTYNGVNNTFIGNNSGFSNGEGADNVFIGHNSGWSNDIGVNNVLIGPNAGYSNITGNNNVIIGKSAGYTYNGSFGNVFIGEEAAENLVSSQRSVMIGYSSGSDVDSLVYGNVYLGGGAGRRMNGWYNVVIGEEAGENYNLGSNGHRNVFIGQSSGRFSTGDENIYIGYGTGRGTFDDPHAGNRNIYLGTDAGWAKRTESDRFRVGGLLWGKLNLVRMLVVDGDDTDNTNSRKFFVNGSAGGTSAWYNDSDERQKKKIKTIDSALDKVMKLRGVTYEWKDTEKHEPGRKMGFIAQESVDIIPEAVDYNEENDHYTMQYASITAVLVEAVKELKNEFTSKFISISETNKMIDVQNEKINNLIKENKELKNKVLELESLRAEIDLIKQQIAGYASK